METQANTPPNPPTAPPMPPPPAAPAPRRPIPWRRILRTGIPLLAVLGLAVAWAIVAFRQMREWGTVKTVVFSIPFVIGVGVVLIFHRALRVHDRVRADWVKQNPDDPTCKHLLIVYGLSQKAIYLPTIVTSLVMSLLMAVKQQWGVMEGLDPKLLGGIWFAVLFLNLFVEEYDVDLRSIIITVVVVAALFMWMAVMNWIPEFFRFFHRFGMQMDATSYLLIASVFLIAIFFSVFKGTFHYVAITPNYINIQMGLAETGEQLSREQYSTRIEAEDLVERMLGFGKLVVVFRDTRRPPMAFLIHGVGRKANQLEGIRGTYLVDQQDPTSGG